MPDFNWFVDIIKIGGPPVIILLFAAVVLLLRENRRLANRVDEMHEDKEQMYKQWREESAHRNERVTNALNNSTVAISTNSANADSIKTSLNAILAVIGGILDRRRGG